MKTFREFLTESTNVILTKGKSKYRLLDPSEPAKEGDQYIQTELAADDGTEWVGAKKVPGYWETISIGDAADAAKGTQALRRKYGWKYMRRRIR